MADIGENQQPEQVCSFFRKPTKNKNIRKRIVDEDEEDDSKTETSLLRNQKKVPRLKFESSKEIQVHHDSRATSTLEIETDFSKDAQAIRERVLKQAEEALKGKGKSSGGEKLYKRVNAYVDYKAGFRREHTILSEKASGSHEPLHIRSSARFDYQPDICKDYKETGYWRFMQIYA